MAMVMVMMVMMIVWVVDECVRNETCVCFRMFSLMPVC